MSVVSRSKSPWFYAIMACLTLGLAPYNPPHIIEKVGMLLEGTLSRPIDIFDLCFHGAPWVYLLFVGARSLRGRTKAE